MTSNSRIGLSDFVAYKKQGKKITAISVAHGQFAQIADEFADCLLIGDSLGMTMYGMENTLGVTMDMMVAHTKAIATITKHAFLIADMPYLSYHTSHADTITNAVSLLKAGAGAVKLEVTEQMLPTVAYLLERGVPVMAHIGLKPQFCIKNGGYKIEGKTRDSYEMILSEAKNFAKIGAFSLLVEGVVEKLATEISSAVKVPVIGIGASAVCDGQILVAEDLLGISTKQAKFSKPYANLREQIKDAFKKYSQEVNSGVFPAKEHTY